MNRQHSKVFGFWGLSISHKFVEKSHPHRRGKWEQLAFISLVIWLGQTPDSAVTSHRNYTSPSTTQHMSGVSSMQWASKRSNQHNWCLPCFIGPFQWWRTEVRSLPCTAASCAILQDFTHLCAHHCEVLIMDIHLTSLGYFINIQVCYVGQKPTAEKSKFLIATHMEFYPGDGQRREHAEIG